MNTETLISFLLGAATGATGTYFAHKYTDKRRSKESKAESRKRFEDTASKMPELIQEMQKGLSDPEGALIREFFVRRNRNVMISTGGRRYFCFQEEEHRDLLHKIRILEDQGFVTDVTHTNLPKFRMSEEFVDYLLKAKFKSGKVKL